MPNASFRPTSRGSLFVEKKVLDFQRVLRYNSSKVEKLVVTQVPRL